MKVIFAFLPLLALAAATGTGTGEESTKSTDSAERNGNETPNTSVPANNSPAKLATEDSGALDMEKINPLIDELFNKMDAAVVYTAIASGSQNKVDDVFNAYFVNAADSTTPESVYITACQTLAELAIKESKFKAKKVKTEDAPKLVASVKKAITEFGFDIEIEPMKTVVSTIEKIIAVADKEVEIGKLIAEAFISAPVRAYIGECVGLLSVESKQAIITAYTDGFKDATKATAAKTLFIQGAKKLLTYKPMIALYKKLSKVVDMEGAEYLKDIDHDGVMGLYNEMVSAFHKPIELKTIPHVLESILNGAVKESPFRKIAVGAVVAGVLIAGTVLIVVLMKMKPQNAH